MDLSPKTRTDTTLANNGSGLIEYTQEAFVRAWGPFMYQGMRKFKTLVKLKNGVIQSLKFTARNQSFPWTLNTSLICR